MLFNSNMSRGRGRPLVIAALSGLTMSCALVLGIERGELASTPADAAPDAAADDSGQPVPQIEAGSDGATWPKDAAQLFDLVLAANPLAYYPFEDPPSATEVRSRTRDLKASERSGIVRGATLGVTGVRGPSDGAMRADAPRARVDLSWSGIPVEGAQFTIELVLLPREIDPNPRFIIVRHDPSSGVFAYRLLAEGDKLVFERARAGQPPERFYSDQKRTDQKLVKDKWMHVAVTFDGSRLRLLLDGEIVNEVRDVVFDVGGPSASTITIGSRSDDEPPFAGTIDEVAVYDRDIFETVVREHAAVLR